VRFGVEAALTIKYGPQIINVVGDLFKHHLTLTLVILAIVAALLLFWVMRKRYKKTGDEDEVANPAEPRRRKLPWQ
jgi:membrane protein DedA with SNARE-associated domain